MGKIYEAFRPMEGETRDEMRARLEADGWKYHGESGKLNTVFMKEGAAPKKKRSTKKKS